MRNSQLNRYPLFVSSFCQVHGYPYNHTTRSTFVYVTPNLLRVKPPSSLSADATSGTYGSRDELEQLSVALGIGGGDSGAGGDGVGVGVEGGVFSSVLGGLQLDAACRNKAAERVRVVEHLIYSLSPFCGKSEKHTPIYK